jgi:hypothetical protein
MNDLTLVTYCGLYCGLCDNLGRLPHQASSLMKTMKDGGWEYFGPEIMPGFTEFWAGLQRLTEADPETTNCRGGCGDPECAIRKCAEGRGVVLCPSCADYPCTNIEKLAKRYPNLISDGNRQREIGLEKWIREQERRCGTGFCYCDIRYDP